MALVLDGPLGTELLARDVRTPLPGWSAHALDDAPDVVRAIHADYAAAGARVHTTNTFRTRERLFPRSWRQKAETAVRLAREAVPAGHRVAGSLAPLEDCYHPELSPADDDPDGTRAEHAGLAQLLAAVGCDLILCETFPHEREGLLAVEAALATGVEVWASFTGGPRADLLTPAQVAAAGRRAAELGATTVLVNCVSAASMGDYLRSLRDAVDGSVPVGCYANAGRPDELKGWSSDAGAPERYADAAEDWVAAGAAIIGGCCGTGVAHVSALSARFGDRDG